MKTTLVILAAGLGSRFGGDKQISSVGPSGEWLMEYSVYDAVRAGFERIVFVLKAEMVDAVKAKCGNAMAKQVEVCYAVQDYSSIPAFYSVPKERVKPFGTIHATLCALPFVDGPFATVNADDYYGVEGFRLMHETLCSLKADGEAVIVPYVLGNTLSENGGVSRGVCEVADGKLVRVEETANIRREGDKVMSDNGEISENAWVSMNFWGFGYKAMGLMVKYFEDFLKALPDGELKAECYLPLFVNYLMEGGTVVRVYPSSDKWFGMTYREDRDDVVERLRALTDSGVYPEKLF